MSIENPSNFLDLCQRLRQEAGLSGSGPSATTGQTGEMLRVVGWIQQAYKDIQNLHTTWRFLRKDFSFQTAAGDQDYTPTEAGITDHKEWVKEDIKIYLTSTGVTGETWLEYETWDFFKSLYMFGSHRTVQGFPTIVTVDPSETLFLWQLPNGIYTVSGEYFAKADVLSGDADTPLWKQDHYMILVWRALMYYGIFAAAEEKYAGGETEYKKMLAELEIDQLPEPVYGDPLA